MFLSLREENLSRMVCFQSSSLCTLQENASFNLCLSDALMFTLEKDNAGEAIYHSCDARLSPLGFLDTISGSVVEWLSSDSCS